MTCCLFKCNHHVNECLESILKLAGCCFQRDEFDKQKTITSLIKHLYKCYRRTKQPNRLKERQVITAVANRSSSDYQGPSWTNAKWLLTQLLKKKEETSFCCTSMTRLCAPRHSSVSVCFLFISFSTRQEPQHQEQKAFIHFISNP